MLAKVMPKNKKNYVEITTIKILTNNININL